MNADTPQNGSPAPDESPANRASATIASDHRVVLDPENPWLGLFSYTEATRAYFHGRDEETAELARRVQHKTLTVLFGQSGLGKTSLLRAGLVPRLRKEGYCPVYVRIDYAAGSPVPALQIRQAIFRVTSDAGHWTRPGSSSAGESLWELLHHRGDFLRDADGQPLTPLLIFDQFEEIFTLGQADDAGKARARQFLEDLADLIENRAPAALEARMDEDDNAAEDFDFGRADYRVLITLREDYLAYLESVKDTMPSITQNRMRLARMNGEQALDAVVKPGGRLVTQEVAEAIVRFVAGGAELKNAEIEPSLLSLVCRELNTIRQTQKRKEISTDLLAGSRETILSEFYERTLADQPEGIRRVVEDELLTESGYRESVAEERVLKALVAAGAGPDALATLVNRRLLRIEERLDMRRVELTHDVLCKVVLASRNTRREREAREQAERQLATQREREAATHKALHRARLIATVSVTLLVLAVASATFGFYNLHRARTAEAQAQASRTNAEGLVSFLIEDFYTALEPTGKLKTLGTLAQKTVDYYNTLPPGQVTQQTQINRAMALARLGSIQLQGGHRDTAEKSFKGARATFEKLRTAGDHSEPVIYGLALIGSAEGWDAINNQIGSTKPLLQAVDLLRPLAKGKTPSQRVLQLYGDDMNGVCAIQSSAGDTTGKSLPACDESLEVLKGLGALDLKDLTAAAGWVNTAYSKASILTTLGRLPEAQALAQQAYTLTDKVLTKRPDDMGSLDNRTYVAGLLATLASRQYDDAKAAEWASKSVEAAKEKVRFDPSNLTSWMNWVFALDSAGQFQFNRGEVTRAIATRRKMVTLAGDPRAPKQLGPSSALLWQHLMLYQAINGDRAGAEQSMQPYLRGQRTKFAKLPPDSPQRRIAETDELFLHSVINLYGGAPQQAFQQASTVIATLETIKVPATDVNALGTQRNVLDINRRIAMRGAVQIGRYAEAEKLARNWLQVAAPYNPTDPSPEAGKAQVRITLAHAIAMQGRKDEARKALQPSLNYYAEQFKAGATSTNFRTSYANALYASAISQSNDAAGAKQRKADLDAAQAQIDGASKEAQQLTTMRHTASLIAAARTGHDR